MALIGKTNEEKIWNFLTSKGLNAYGVAGLMGNLYAESALNPQNLQNTYERKLGLTDAEYTAAVDAGTYTGFVRDSAGLCESCRGFNRQSGGTARLFIQGAERRLHLSAGRAENSHQREAGVGRCADQVRAPGRSKRSSTDQKGRLRPDVLRQVRKGSHTRKRRQHHE